jgi:hypothetical protein
MPSAPLAEMEFDRNELPVLGGEDPGTTIPARALPVIEHDYEDGPIRLYPFVCRVLGGEARAMAADELRWVSAAELSRYQFPAANERLIRTLMEGKSQAEV